MKLHPLIIVGLTTAVLHAQVPAAVPVTPVPAAPSADPYSDEGGNPLPGGTGGATSTESQDGNISVCYETFSLPLATSAKWQREGLSDAAIYQRFIAAVEEGTAEQENFLIVRSRSGEKASSEGIGEYIYYTEAEPPELPNSVGVAVSRSTGAKGGSTLENPTNLEKAPDFSAVSGLRTPAMPTAFQTRNTGLTLELEPILREDGQAVHLRISAEHVALVDRISWGQELSEVEMPEFERQGVISGATVRLNTAHLLGTISRTPNSKVNPDSANRVWFAFVTVSLPKH